MNVSFIIPFHNEEKNCPKMIEKVVSYAQKKKMRYEIISVDDRSTDGTIQILRELAKKNNKIIPVYRRDDGEEKGNTMGLALKEGTKKAKGDIIIWTMGDLADDTKTYGDIIEKIEKGYDMVFGSRYMPGGSRGNLDRMKAFLSSWGTRFARFLFGIGVHDITNAFRGFRKDVFQSISLSSPGFSISPEFAIKAHLAGFRLGEVPTVYTNRVEGVSNFKIYQMTTSYLTLFWNLFLTYQLQKRPFDFVHKKK